MSKYFFSLFKLFCSQLKIFYLEALLLVYLYYFVFDSQKYLGATCVNYLTCLINFAILSRLMSLKLEEFIPIVSSSFLPSSGVKLSFVYQRSTVRFSNVPPSFHPLLMLSLHHQQVYYLFVVLLLVFHFLLLMLNLTLSLLVYFPLF